MAYLEVLPRQSLEKSEENHEKPRNSRSVSRQLGKSTNYSVRRAYGECTLFTLSQEEGTCTMHMGDKGVHTRCWLKISREETTRQDNFKTNLREMYCEKMT